MLHPKIDIVRLIEQELGLFHSYEIESHIFDVRTYYLSTLILFYLETRVVHSLIYDRKNMQNNCIFIIVRKICQTEIFFISVHRQ